MVLDVLSEAVERPPPISTEAEEVLAETLPDHPLSFAPRCVLKRHVGSAWVRGPLTGPDAAVVVDPWAPSEPSVFGTDPEEVWDLLRTLPGWSCVNCDSDLAHALAPVLEHRLGLATRLLADVYFTLEAPPVPFRHPAVRRLTEDDLELVERAPRELHPVGFDSILAALSGGVVAGALAESQLVARTSLTYSSEAHADIASYTLADWRDRGYASAALSMVAAEVRARGWTPVWSAGETNLASQRVAQKIGFREVGRKAYVIVPRLEEAAGFRPRSE